MNWQAFKREINYGSFLYVSSYFIIQLTDTYYFTINEVMSKNTNQAVSVIEDPCIAYYDHAHFC